ncbi:MAG TPA: 2-phosphosulfolactate phosphatase [Vicinamibacterales bacterium]|nr:2-phosphosulfolactate phosphatase [Vicinamibacterales bacterium]
MGLRSTPRVVIVEGVDGARAARGTVVVIDVMRAFTTAAYAFAAGAVEIDLVSTVEQALARPGFRMGEVGGRLIPGFDHNNSPSRLVGAQLAGRRAVLRTGSGTQCVTEATGATEIWLGSLVVASATVRALADRQTVTLVVSGAPREGEEDRACAELMAAWLRGTSHSRESVVDIVRASRAAARHVPGDSDFPPADLDCATAIDAFDFAMKAEQRERLWTARLVPMPSRAR